MRGEEGRGEEERGEERRGEEERGEERRGGEESAYYSISETERSSGMAPVCMSPSAYLSEIKNYSFTHSLPLSFFLFVYIERILVNARVVDLECYGFIGLVEGREETRREYIGEESTCEAGVVLRE